jgi:hypothetical protein
MANVVTDQTSFAGSLKSIVAILAAVSLLV